MKFYYSLYDLQPKKFKEKEPTPSARKGAIIKVEWDSDRVGYADLHPWPEFGDEELEFHLAELRQMRITALVEQAIWLASIDATGRRERQNTYDNHVLLKNNAIITRIDPHTVELLDPFVKAGFSRVKIKVGKSLDEELEFLNRASLTHNIKIRLDFNSRLTFSGFERFVEDLSPEAKRQIEYVEDPFPYEAESWKKANELLPLAIDWELKRISLREEKPVQAEVMVIKPTHEDVNARLEQALKWNKKMTITSHMGHPLGVMQCAQVAQNLYKKYSNYMLDPGCLTFDLFEPTEFNSLLNIQGPYIKKVGGWGIGFDFILKSQKWNQLRTR